MMPRALTVDEIYNAIRSLPRQERLRLVEQVVHDTEADSESPQGSETSPASQDLEAWSEEVDELARQIPPSDFDRLDAALEEADQKAKEYVRRQMGLPR